METLTLTPAYGRDYNNKAAVQADWQAGKDFIIANAFHRYDGKPINKPQADNDGLTVHIRYLKLRRIMVINPEVNTSEA
jgi:hypothetical protein